MVSKGRVLYVGASLVTDHKSHHNHACADVKVVTKEIYARFKREKLNPTQPASARSLPCCVWPPPDLTADRRKRWMILIMFFFFLFVGIGILVAVVMVKTADSVQDNSSSTVHTASFEEDFGGWTTSTFLRNSGSTETPGTGPNGAVDGSYYVYAETSNPNSPGFEFSMFRNFGVDGHGHGAVASVSFYYNMYGSTMGTVLLQGSNDEGLTPTTLWSKSGSQPTSHGGNVWHNSHVDCGGGYQTLRFVYTSGLSVTGDFALDSIRTKVNK